MITPVCFGIEADDLASSLATLPPGLQANLLNSKFLFSLAVSTAQPMVQGSGENEVVEYV